MSARIDERVFAADAAGRARIAYAATAVGAAAVGAGTYAQWMRDEPHAAASWLLALGAVGLSVAAVLGDKLPAVRAGALGVAVERAGERPERLAWCDVTRVALAGGTLVLEGEGRKVELALAQHRAAAAFVLAEATARIPARVQLGDDERALVGAVDAAAGKVERVEPPQLAGKRCRASGKLVAFEDDARPCARCGAIYHREQVPAACTVCGAPT